MKWLVVLTLVLFAQFSFGDDDLADISQFWFQPSLTVNNDAAICDPILSVYVQYFKGRGGLNPLMTASYDYQNTYKEDRERIEYVKVLGDSVSELEWLKLDDKSYNRSSSYRHNTENLTIAEFSINGQYYGLIRDTYRFSSAKLFHSNAVIDVPLEKSQLSKDELYDYIGRNDISSILKNDNGDFEIISKENWKPGDSINNSVSGPKNAYIKDGQVYITFDLPEEPDYFGAEGSGYGVFKVAKDFKLKLTCAIKTLPTKKEIQAQQNKIKHLEAYAKVLSDIMGDGGSCGGTSRIHSFVLSAMVESLEAMIYRPWANYYSNGTRERRSVVSIDDYMEAKLDKWRYSGIWNFYKFKTFASLRLSIEDELTQFNTDNFPLTEKEAREWASASITNVLVATFDHGEVYDKNHDLHRLLLDGASPEKILAAIIPENIDSFKGYGAAGGDSLLVYAIEQPTALTVLLERGLDPNNGNSFNKTPLMYAAQYNATGSAKILLESGIDFNASTTKDQGTWCNIISTQDVTALHYAVRYASADFIVLLLEYGALTSARDSNGATPLDYLIKAPHWNPDKPAYGASNKLLSKGDISFLKQQLKPPTKEQRAQLSKKENIVGQGLYQEKQYRKALFHFRKAMKLNDVNYQAQNNFSLTALNLGRVGEAAKVLDELVKSEADDKIKSAAYFNLGLACEIQGKASESGYYYEYIDYNSNSYCYESGESKVDYFMSSYKHGPTEARLNKVVELFTKKVPSAGNNICFSEELSSDVKSIYITDNDIYMLMDKGRKPPYKSMSWKSSSDFGDLKNERFFSLGNDYDIIFWDSPVSRNEDGYVFDNGHSCVN